MDEAALQAMVDARVQQALATRTKASGTTGLGIPPHGYTSLFNTPGVDPGIATTYIGPRGVEDYLEKIGHVQRSQFLNPLVGILTGQTASSGSEPTGPCSEDVPVPGDLKMCYFTWPFGEFTMKTKPIRIDNAGALINRSEPLDLRLLNNPFADAAQIVPAGDQNLFRNKLAKSVVELTNDFKRRYAQEVYIGAPSRASYFTDGVYGATYNGLDRIVNTGYQSSISQADCDALDSVVVNRSGAIIQNTAAATVQTYVETYRQLTKLAEDIGANDVEWVFFMRYQKFLSLTQVWPCAYETYRCFNASPGGADIVIDMSASDQQQMRQAMRDGMYLLIDGKKVPVVTDSTLIELNIGSGNFQSDTYLLAVRSPSLGGQLLYMDYFNYRGPFGMQAILPQLGPQDEYRVSPDGRFAIFFLAGTAFCKQVMIRTAKRIIERAPFLCAKIEDERYAVYAHERDWQPGTSFFQDGGNTSFSGTSFYSPV